MKVEWIKIGQNHALIRNIILLMLIISIFSLTGCSLDSVSNQDNTQKEVISPKIARKYSVGDEIILAGVSFDVYKIDNEYNKLYLMARSNVATIHFSAIKPELGNYHEYEKSMVKRKVDRFVDDFEDAGILIDSSGIIDKDDLIALGFEMDDQNNAQYKISNAPNFLQNEESFWVDGSEDDTYAWVYHNGILTTKMREEEYGVRPILVISTEEVDRPRQKPDTDLTIKEIIESDCAWSSEGGIANPYDRYYFDCEEMLFINIFESYKFSDTRAFKMEFIDEKTIQVDGLMRNHEFPAEITVINESKLRFRFIDDAHNKGDYYLNRVYE